ncbi:MAG: 3-hydroxyacyl-ACP dehydratase FabZ [Proteobacteria bacterium]|nr:3-hydroxyacyl-ACP dehydratase FabZ [Pseudomonadota bacterium]
MSVMQIEEILASIPHRYPFLLIDRVIEFEKNKRLLALKNVTINEHYFSGHFPGTPVMPGVLILEAMAQACAVLACLTENRKLGDEPPPLHLFAGIDNARFKQIVLPGDQLYLDVQLLWCKRGIWKLHGEAKVDGKVVCSADLMSAIKETTK